MKIKQLLESFWNNNGHIKVFCLVGAVIIYAVYQFSLLEKKTFVIPLEITEEGTMTAASSVDRLRSVKVTVRTKRELLPTVTENDLTARVDISAQSQEGTASYPVLVTPSERLMLMEPLEISSSPDRVTLSVEQDMFRYVPLQASLAGTPAHGYEVGEAGVEPDSIRISGPRSVVEAVRSVPTQKVDVSGIARTVTREVLPENGNALLAMDVQSPVTVTVTLVPASGSKLLSRVPVSLADLADGLAVTNGPFTLDIELKGHMLDAETVSVSQVLAQVDCSSVAAAGTYSLPVTVIIPDSLSIVSQSVEAVELSVEAIPVQDEELPGEEG